MAEIKPMDEKEIDAMTEGASHYAPAVQEKLWWARMEIRRLKCETAHAETLESKFTALKEEIERLERINKQITEQRIRFSTRAETVETALREIKTRLSDALDDGPRGEGWEDEIRGLLCFLDTEEEGKPFRPTTEAKTDDSAFLERERRYNRNNCCE